MKNTILLAALLMMAGQAFAACPDLAGTYPKCSGDYPQDVPNGIVVIQKVVDGKTTYELVDEESSMLLIEGETVLNDMSEEEMELTVKVSTTCQNDAVKLGYGLDKLISIDGDNADDMDPEIRTMMEELLQSAFAATTTTVEINEAGALVMTEDFDGMTSKIVCEKL